MHDDGEDAVTKGKGGHEEGSESASEEELGGEGECVEEMVRLSVPRGRGVRDEVGRVGGANNQPRDKENGTGMKAKAVQAIRWPRKEGFARMPNVSSRPSEANASHGKLKLQSP